MKAENEIFCQPTIASLFDREPRGLQAGDHCFKASWRNTEWLVSPVRFRNLQISGYVRWS